MTQPFVNSADQWFTGTGILLQGDPFRANTTGFQGVPLKDGRVEYFMAIGFPKDQPAATGFNELYAMMYEVAKTHPNAAQYIPSNFAGFHFKLEDGDAPQNINKPGWKGCWVLKCKNGFQPQVFDENRNAVISPYIDNVDAEGKIVSQTQKPGVSHPFPCGHFVRAMIAIKPNKSAPPQSGLYINISMIQRVGYGTPIYSGPDYGSILGAQQAAALPGMSAIPTGGPAPVMAAGPGAPPAGPASGPTGLPPAPGAAAPAVGMPPAPGGLPAAPAAPPAPPVVETPQSRMIDQQYTYDQYIQAGYTEAGLIAQGLMRPAAQPAAPVGGGLPPAPTGMPPAPPAATPGMPPAPGTLPPAGHQYNQ